jgi:hypothetical protein
MSSRAVETRFSAVSELCIERKFDKAVKVAMTFLDTYQHKEMILRRDEIQKNIRKGTGDGLARTGRGYAPIHFFCDLKDEHAEEINLLIRARVDVNAVAYKAGYTERNPKNPFTPILQATDRGFSTIVSLLLAVPGIRTDVRDGNEFTPLMIACRRGHYNIVKQLLAFPLPSQYSHTWYGNSLLHDAARRCDPELVELLLDHAFPIDQRDDFGKTALMHAVIKTDITDADERIRRSRGRYKTVQILLESGADPTLRDSKTGILVREYALKEGDEDLTLLLGRASRQGVSELVA